MISSQSIKVVLFIVFSVSGFAGLIYESIWTHYLKLVLGHAAYSQTLVLSLFMGGMALGSWLVSTKTNRISNPLLLYAVVELIIGLLALFFHDIFIYTQKVLFSAVLPGLESAQAASLVRWTWASMLILPQSILLGATFPLMSAGIIRLFPQKTGSVLAMLYFTNSIGAAIGVLASGFVLIDLVGLPGTILTAGVLNIFLALFVWLITKKQPAAEGKMVLQRGQPAVAAVPQINLFLATAFFTGLASFCYEIAWIRMLNLVLGTTTQSFELMLSAFITGIALGGLWVRQRIDSINNFFQFAGYVQIVMGVLAVFTLLFYNSTFDFMNVILHALKRNQQGYLLFMSASHLVAFVIMVPTTFMAGMTLPLLTTGCIKKGYGEKGIGRIYAFNTLGSIVGIMLAVHFVMPFLGVKNLVAFGSFVDILLGMVLLYFAGERVLTGKVGAAVLTSLALFFAVNIFVGFDRGKMASCVYRDGDLHVNKETIVFHKDGKTATVAVQQDYRGENKAKFVSIRTNGKPDASVLFDDKTITGDEITMALLAAYPLAIKPDSRTAAVIGMGSGITTSTLLKVSKIESVDTVEIESAMVEGAGYFRPYSDPAFDDPRSHIHLDDAKSFFSVNKKKYDLIISEPSNPWVSGVASLFSEEFYHQIKPHLNQDGVFTQWLQSYEINLDLMASVFKAISRNFKYYSVYLAGPGDVVILASDNELVNTIDPWILKHGKLGRDLERVNIKTDSDLYARRIGTQKSLDPLFMVSYRDIPANSDYFPLLERMAPKARFLQQHTGPFTHLPYSVLPVMDFIDPLPSDTSRFGTTYSEFFFVAKKEKAANDIFDHLLEESPLRVRHKDAIRLAIRDIFIYRTQGHISESLSRSLVQIAQTINIFMVPEKAAQFWQTLITDPCFDKLDALNKALLNLYHGVGSRDLKRITSSVELIMQMDYNKLNSHQITYVHTAALAAYMAAGNVNGAGLFQKQFSEKMTIVGLPQLTIRLLLAHLVFESS